MPTQDFNIYTARGYAGELVDSGPRVVQTGILTTDSSNDNGVGFGIAVQRDTGAGKPTRGIKLGATEVGTSETVNLFALTQREYNHEASLRPSDGTTVYNQTESVSLIRQGYLYVNIFGSGTLAAGDAVNVVVADGTLSVAAITDTNIPAINCFVEEDVLSSPGTAGALVKVRIDITG